MTGTEITPLHPFQDDLSCLKYDQSLAHYTHELEPPLYKKDAFHPAEVISSKPEFNTVVSSPCSTLSSITPSSPSSMRASRLSLPSIWNSSVGDSSVLDTSYIPSASPIWSYSFCDLPLSPNKSNTTTATTTEANSPPSPCGYQPTPNPLRSIWSCSTMDHQEPSHQRRMSLSDYNASDDRSPQVPETQQTATRNLGHISCYGRRHSVAGAFTPNLANKTNGNSVYRWMQDSPWSGATNDYPMKAIDEDETFLYANTQYSRHQQHILNKGILDHIDEYFGGGNKKHRVSAINTMPSANMDSELPDSLGTSYYLKGQSPSKAHTTIAAAPPPTPPAPVLSPTATPSSLETTFGKTMTAGGDAINFGCSNILMGKGIPLHHFLDSNTLLYLVEFKTGRTDICYIMQGDTVLPEIGDLVITEADRGRDLGKVMNILTANTIIQKQQHLDGTKAMMDMVTNGDGQLINGNNDEAKDDEKLQVSQKCQVKRLYRLADGEETASLTTKQLDEEKALLVCQTKIQQKELPMQVVNAEYQWDRRKLTFYFMADQRIDFRELVRELFKTYKTRIWMCALKSNTSDRLSCE
ncbi:unnamed protein product [Absidia cylindrospora]